MLLATSSYDLSAEDWLALPVTDHPPNIGVVWSYYKRVLLVFPQDMCISSSRTPSTQSLHKLVVISRLCRVTFWSLCRKEASNAIGSLSWVHQKPRVNQKTKPPAAFNPMIHEQQNGDSSLGFGFDSTTSRSPYRHQHGFLRVI